MGPPSRICSLSESAPAEACGQTLQGPPTLCLGQRMDFGSHPLLRPDAVICLRGDDSLQVGFGPDAVRAPDVGPVRDLLTRLRDGAPAPELSALDPRAARCYLDLLDHHLVINGDEYVALVGRMDDPAAQQALTSDVVESGSAAARQARSAVTVGIDAGAVPGAEATWRRLLGVAGFDVRLRPLADDVAADAPTFDVLLLLQVGPTPRSLSDRLISDDVPHLVVECLEGRMRLGPFVVPGRSACLRCVDAERCETDPRHPLIVEQYARHRAAWPAPVPHDLLQVALGCAVRDLTRWVDGEQPTTWSAVLDIDPALALTRTTCRPHPHCGCAWDSYYRAAE